MTLGRSCAPLLGPLDSCFFFLSLFTRFSVLDAVAAVAIITFPSSSHSASSPNALRVFRASCADCGGNHHLDFVWPVETPNWTIIYDKMVSYDTHALFISLAAFIYLITVENVNNATHTTGRRT